MSVFIRRCATPLTARLADLAPVLKTDTAGLLARLRAKGFQVASADQSLDDLAKAANVPAPASIAAALPPQP